ncbi:uncharacterized protein MELLADRAFT_76626 [Melampsora larici-populina 98AG31]|uniref:Nucleoporin Nup186/Nup192/Nup205 n=1 Tax=Melampsora larici-populina (strain 98AG31 / pathotype 3-4-7) TaxID=747676 RepID=F4R7N0_MELLP|nr:uncharacterized protein MELLADRAFT_76626 [Melampsora larici-populina 98AG31]EGG11345.1 hypothetical protein MELLADRAFT_76626 [Melampsora larici-populina 98AG31]
MTIDYVPDLFSHLCEFLEDTFTRPDPSLVPKLRLELDRARPHLINLLDKPSRNAKEAERIRKGQFVYQGTTHSHTPDFTQEALYLSEQLDISENNCAILLQHGMSRKSRYGRANADSAVIMYYRERSALLRSLKLIFQAGDSEEMIQSGMTDELEKFRQGLVESSVKINNKPFNWIDKVFEEVKNSKKEIQKLKNQLTSTTPNLSNQTTTPNLGFGFGSSLNNSNNQTLTSSNNVIVKFSDEIVQKMMEQHQSERRDLGQIIYLIGFARLFQPSHIASLIDSLAEMDSQDPLIYHFLTTFLAAIDGDCTSVTEAEYDYFLNIWNDTAFMRDLNQRLTSKRWLVKQAKAVALLQWCLFLGSAYQQEPRLEHETEIWEDQIDQMVMASIQNGAFPFMVSDLLGFKKKSLLEESPSRVLGPRSEEAMRTSTADDLLGIEEDFRSEVVSQIDRLMISFVTSLQSVLRRLRNQEEDAFVSMSMQFRPSPQFTAPDAFENTPAPPRHDIEALFEVIAALHRDTSDSALIYWGVDEVEDEMGSPAMMSGRSTKLTGFVRWASECRQLGMVKSFYEMLASLATGPRCSDLAYSFLLAGSCEENGVNPPPNFGRIGDGHGGLNIPSCAWSSIFGQLQYYIQLLQSNVGQKKLQSDPRQLAPAELSILKGYAKIIRQVVKYSPTAQATLYDHQKYKPIQTLFALAACPISLDLKAELLLAIAAFAAPGNKISPDIARKCWLTLEHSQILSTHVLEYQSSFGLGGATQGGYASGQLAQTGILAELDEVEAANRIYPSSTAFITLLVALIHPPMHRSPVKKGEELELQSIPENLGALSRSPGIDPYVRFVIDEVFRKVGSRDFLFQEERYKVFEVCLAFIERCLTSYDVASFLTSTSLPETDPGNKKQAHHRTIFSAVTHPGFDILLRILNNTELTRQLFETLLNGPRFVENSPQRSDTTCRCVLRTLRIIKRVTELQGAFLGDVLPHILEFAPDMIPQERLVWAKSAQSLDQHIFYSNSVVVSTAVLVGCIADDEVAYLAVKLLAHIAESTFFTAADHFQGQYPGRMNRLLGLLDSSEESLLILGNFIGRLEGAASSFRDIDDDDFVVDLSGELDDRDMTRVQPAIRNAILDLLLRNTQPHRVAPNFAHYLLGFDVRTPKDTLKIADPRSPEAKLSCFHTILDLLRMGQSGPEGDVHELGFSLLERDTLLAEKAFKLIQQLCLHDYSSKAVSYYLRSTERYFVTQASILPLNIPANPEVVGGELTYSSGEKIVTSCSSVVATLKATAWLLESISLELNVLTEQVRRDNASELVSVLFGSASSSNQARSILDQAGAPDQSLPRMQELFLRLDFNWKNFTEVEPQGLKIFGHLNFEECCIEDENGCQLFDLGSVLNLLGVTRQEMKRRGMLNGTAQQLELQDEIKFIITSIVIENQRREIASAQYHMLRAWSILLRLTLTRAFHLLPPENRHVFLLDLLASVLPKLVAGATDPSSAELLSEIVVALMIKLRHEGTHLESLAPGEATQAFPFDRLMPVLRAIIQSIVLSNTSNVLRGNLYASILSFLQHVYATSACLDSSSQSNSESIDILKLGNEPTSMNDETSTLTTQRKSNKRNSLETNTMSMFLSSFERLLPIICKDSVMGNEVWKSVGFTILDSLLLFSDKFRNGGQFINVLSKNGFLKDFVDLLKDNEGDLMAVLEPDPESLNALYVYETQMAFLLRVAATRAGAEKLIEAKILARLGECNYLGRSSQAQLTDPEFDTFIPSASERYHQLLLPALQLVASILIALGSESSTAAREAVSFIAAQREMLITCLRSPVNLSTSVGIQEVHLVTTILRIALPLIGDQEMASSTSYGAMHSSLLAISSTVCGHLNWIERVGPVTDNERADATINVPGSTTNFTVFQEKIRDLALSLVGSVLTYLRVATQRRRPGPTFRTILGFLNDSISLLEFTISQTSILTQRLNNWSKITRDEVTEILGEEETGNYVNYDSDKKLKAKKKILETLGRSSSRSVVISNIIDMTLLLFWKDATYHFENDELNEMQSNEKKNLLTISSFKATTNHQQFGRNQLQESNLKEDTLNSLRPMFYRLQNLDLAKGGFSKDDIRIRNSYLEALVRTIGSLFHSVTV